MRERKEENGETNRRASIHLQTKEIKQVGIAKCRSKKFQSFFFFFLVQCSEQEKTKQTKRKRANTGKL